MATITESIEAAEERLKVLRDVRKNHPTAVMEVLWESGLAVPVVYGDDWQERSAGVIAMNSGKDIMLYPYGVTPAGNRVYFLPSPYRGGFYASLVLKQLTEHSPEVVVAILDACRSQG